MLTFYQTLEIYIAFIRQVYAMAAGRSVPLDFSDKRKNKWLKRQAKRTNEQTSKRAKYRHFTAS